MQTEAACNYLDSEEGVEAKVSVEVFILGAVICMSCYISLVGYLLPLRYINRANKSHLMPFKAMGIHGSSLCEWDKRKMI